jgi:hypothetical protein
MHLNEAYDQLLVRRLCMLCAFSAQVLQLQVSSLQRLVLVCARSNQGLYITYSACVTATLCANRPPAAAADALMHARSSSVVVSAVARVIRVATAVDNSADEDSDAEVYTHYCCNL